MDSSEIDGFWEALKPIIFTAQLFTLFPVSGIFAKDVRKIGFQWVSLRTLYSILFLVLAALVIVAKIFNTVSSSISNKNITAIIYYILNFSGTVSFFLIATNWRTIMLYWTKCEEIFLRPPYKMKGRSLKFQIRMVGFSLLFLAIVEDFLHVGSCYTSNAEYVSSCDNSTPFWEIFYTREHNHIFQYVDYSLPMALLVEFTHKVYLFMWSFMDLFITLISLGLSMRFEQLYRRIEHLKGKPMPDAFWAEVRLHYTRMSNLVSYMDGVLSPMVLITCASDIYFITFQLYMSVQLNASLLSTVYYRFSLLFLIFRALLMLLTSSHVFVASRKPLEILRAVPMCSWTTNVQRFTHEILNIENALSGHKFFFLKRKIILGMAGTLITYELVMLSEVKSTDDVSFCDAPHRLY